MSTPIQIQLTVVEPVELLLDTAPVYYIGTSQAGPQGLPGEMQIGSGAKYSSTDAGTLNQLSLDDDYLYICVETGTAGSAKWKKTPLFLST